MRRMMLCLLVGFAGCSSNSDPRGQAQDYSQKLSKRDADRPYRPQNHRGEWQDPRLKELMKK